MKLPEILLVETVHQPGSLAKVLQVIAESGLIIEHLNALRREQGRTLWEITLEMDESTDRSLYERIDRLPTARWNSGTATHPRTESSTPESARSSTCTNGAGSRSTRGLPASTSRTTR